MVQERLSLRDRIRGLHMNLSVGFTASRGIRRPDPPALPTTVWMGSPFAASYGIGHPLMLTNVREVSAIFALTLLVVSVRTMLVYLTQARTNV